MLILSGFIGIKNFFKIRIMKFIKFILIVALIFHFFQSTAQDNGGSKVSVGNFVRLMYNAQPFDGVKILQTQDGLDHMVSVVALKKDPNRAANIESRIASVKAKAFASQFVNGSNISSEVLVVTIEEKTKDSVVTKSTMQEIIKESSMVCSIHKT